MKYHNDGRACSGHRAGKPPITATTERHTNNNGDREDCAGILRARANDEERSVSVDEEGKGVALKRHDFQIRDAIEVSCIVGAYCVAKFERTSTDDEIRNGQIDSFSRLFATNASNDLCRSFGDPSAPESCV